MENFVIAFMMIVLFAFGSIVVYCFNRFLNEMYKNSSEEKRTRVQLKKIAERRKIQSHYSDNRSIV